jgi:glycogen debranching enzyme
VPAAGQHALGFYRDDCRYLCGHELRGELVERRIVAPGELEEVVRGESLALAADFQSVIALHGLADELRREPAEPEAIDGGIRFAARGIDGVERALVVHGAPADGHLGGESTLRYSLLDPTAADAELRAPRHPSVVTDDERFNRLLGVALDDLQLLESEIDGRAYYAAGVPWYATLFGRDSLITALQMLAFDPGVAADTLTLLADRLGSQVDPAREEEPGKVLHELRLGEAAATPFGRYYGTVDATPLALCLLAEHTAWAGSAALPREPVDAMLGWIGDRLLTYAPSAPGGLRNQGWKDSRTGVPGPGGEPLEPPIGLVEPQAYAWRARRALGLDAPDHIERFWLPQRGYYALALGTDVIASNQGHLLWAGAVSPDRARSIRDALMSPRSFSGWGIRTLAEGEPGYDPDSYHRGTVWPHDTALIAAGLRRYGFDADFTRVFGALLDAADSAPDGRLAELFGGAPRGDAAAPDPYDIACRPQAWAAGAIPYLFTAGLGLVPEAGRLKVVDPVLPPGVSEVEIRGLRVGDAEVDLRIAGDKVEV